MAGNKVGTLGASWGAPSITSSTHFTDSTIVLRSASFITGGPLAIRISLSGMRPSTSSSPSALACRMALAWP